VTFWVWYLALAALVALLSVSRGGHLPSPWFWWAVIIGWCFGGFIMAGRWLFRQAVKLGQVGQAKRAKEALGGKAKEEGHGG
jgi:hypothetical protein